MQKSFWMSRDVGCLADGEMGCDSSPRIEPKRGQWFMDTTGAGPELLSNKRQAIEVVDRPALGNSLMNVFPWHSNSSFQSVSGQFSDRVFGSEMMGSINVVDRSFPSVGFGNMNAGGKESDDQYCGSSSMGLSVSQRIQAPSGCLNVGGIRKVKVNQVRDASRDFVRSYRTGESNAYSAGTNYDKNDNDAMYLHTTYGNEDRNDMSVSPTFGKADANFISMGLSNKADANFTSMPHNFNKGHSVLSMGQPFEKVEGNFITMTPSYGKGENNVISITPSYYKGDGNFISMGPIYDKGDGNFISMSLSYSKGEDNFISSGPTCDKVDSNITSISSGQDKVTSNILSMGHNFNKVDGNTISFGGFHDEPEANSGCIISGFGVSLINQDSAPDSEVQSQKGLVKSNAELVANSASKTKNKEKITRKVPPNNFPSNVKSLLSTGMLDGVPVKYVSWSREKSLKAKIKGTGYLCSCKDCNSSKVLNAYEFERHANCKTKHPNNHIYFENGKTIYAVVQELKNTPQEMLFDAIQNVTGSQVNQKNFRIWKASYQAATRELQRIYGKDEVVLPSLD
ncbi:hypothetical protein K2173_020430 [Erythroxylum novogranatense]|uniref:Tify domain-containing protein n=1 Tax=Erythroxylum novogranatense TaxID=1862640 RepID=A0AAV8TIW6_9ROSI|nr:hypothetical protein K2173_020430 [Erythroxylum novogranatense]